MLVFNMCQVVFKVEIKHQWESLLPIVADRDNLDQVARLEAKGSVSHRSKQLAIATGRREGRRPDVFVYAKKGKVG